MGLTVIRLMYLNRKLGLILSFKGRVIIIKTIVSKFAVDA